MLQLEMFLGAAFKYVLHWNCKQKWFNHEYIA